MLRISIQLDIDMFLILVLIFQFLLTTAYVLFDVNYFLMVTVVFVWGRFHKKITPDQTTTFYGMCTTQDLDFIFSHMNNARFLRELDFARLHFFERTGLYREIITKKGAQSFLNASHIRYRRPIPLFSVYKITTKIIYWDDKNVYLEHQFVTLKDGFIRAVVLCKQAVVGVDVNKMVVKLLGEKEEDFRPEPHPELKDWLQMIDKSSARLKKKESAID